MSIHDITVATFCLLTIMGVTSCQAFSQVLQKKASHFSHNICHITVNKQVII